MALITWKEIYSVDISEIDSQHKKLIDMINSLHDGMIGGKNEETISKVLFDLIDYTTTHFLTEEKLFDKYGYPETELHKQQHNNLVEKVIEIQNRYHYGEPVLTMELINFLRDWLNEHIIGSDKKYSPFLKSKGVS